MTDDPQPPPEIDRATITTMQMMVRGAINDRHLSVGEAAELARGYCYARHPALPAAALSAAVDYVLMSLQLLRPMPFSVERDGREYSEVSPHHLARHIGYMFRFDERGKPYAAASLKEDLASVAALYLVRHMTARGYIVLAPKQTEVASSAGNHWPKP